MNVLLDTHVFLWFFLNDPRLKERQRTTLRDRSHELYLSAVSLYEIGTKARLGKLPRSEAISAQLDTIYQDFDLRELTVQTRHAIVASRFASDHRDPFDRLLAAQSIIEKMPLMTTDDAFGGLGVKTIW